MSINIEKLRLENKHSVLTRLTLTDLIFENDMKKNITYNDINIRTDLIRDKVVEKLKEHNIFLGKQYGVKGIPIKKLLEESTSLDYHIEIPTGHIINYNIQDLRQLSFKHKIIFVDFEESNVAPIKWIDDSQQERKTFFNEFLKISGFNLNNTYFASPNIEKNRICKDINFYYIFVVMASLCSNITIDILLNNNKEQYIEILKNRPYEKFFIFKNWSARPWRVALLSILNKHRILDEIDWSLVGEYGPHKFNDNKDFVKEYFSKYTNNKWIEENYFKEEIQQFFVERINELPKFLYEHEYSAKVESIDVWTSPINDLKKYRYSIDVESCSFLSEKQVKSFLMGSMPFVIYPYKTNRYIQQLKHLNFNIVDVELEKKNIESHLENSADKIIFLKENDICPDIAEIIHNFEMCVDSNKLVDYVTQPLIDTFISDDKYVRT